MSEDTLETKEPEEKPQKKGFFQTFFAALPELALVSALLIVMPALVELVPSLREVGFIAVVLAVLSGLGFFNRNDSIVPVILVAVVYASAHQIGLNRVTELVELLQPIFG